MATPVVLRLVPNTAQPMCGASPSVEERNLSGSTKIQTNKKQHVLCLFSIFLPLAPKEDITPTKIPAVEVLCVVSALLRSMATEDETGIGRKHADAMRRPIVQNARNEAKASNSKSKPGRFRNDGEARNMRGSPVFQDPHNPKAHSRRLAVHPSQNSDGQVERETQGKGRLWPRRQRKQ